MDKFPRGETINRRELIAVYLETVCEEDLPVFTSELSSKTLRDTVVMIAGRLAGARYSETLPTPLSIYSNDGDEPYHPKTMRQQVEQDIAAQTRLLDKLAPLNATKGEVWPERFTEQDSKFSEEVNAENANWSYWIERQAAMALSSAYRDIQETSL